MRMKIVRRTLEALEGLKHLDQLHRTEDIRVFRGDLDDDLQVLSNVDTEHLVHAAHGLLCRQTAEVVDQPL